ncbi:hypothetical protein [Nitrolancea hollandica]|uniref:Uncharacterized protein n=1 Tax=Nitrolancea hollandica Lb TaxID=1129897 RepID=I4EFL8_9BACT|nr:hypothetical protein [Nitrolancea hollandica]CCF83480.1 hypothetical protein NITHO_2310023 [Nitrolancea hollandica Lb]
MNDWRQFDTSANPNPKPEPRRSIFRDRHGDLNGFGIALVGLVGFFVLALVGTGILVASKSMTRYQRLADARNEIQVNAIKINQTQQLVEVEKQKAAIKVQEAKGIAEAQHIINATLTDQYLAHEAIQAQRELANTSNHSTVYIPVGNNGIPIVRTEDGNGAGVGE